MSEFKKTEIIDYTRRKKTAEAGNWGKWEQPVTIQEYGAIDRISISPVEPNYFAITSSSKVLIYNPVIKDVYKTIRRFKDNPYSAKFRRDGKLLCVGTTEGQVQIFDIATKTMLRVLRGHSAAVRQCEFTADNVHVATFSDDKTVGVWDLATETRLDTLCGHKEYVRCGVTSNNSSDLLLSGSYDETVALWDRRTKDEPVLKINHGAPVEDVLLLSGDSLFVTAGRSTVKFWDLTAGGKMLCSLSPHHKLITSLCLADNGDSLVTGSLDRQVKRISLSDFSITGSLSFPSSVLSVDVDQSNKYVVAGMTDGLVQIVEKSKEELVSVKGSIKYNKRKKFRNLKDNEPNIKDGDVLVRNTHKVVEKQDKFLRKYEYSEALDIAIKSNDKPEKGVSVMQELMRRDCLEVALAGREGVSLERLLTYINNNIGDVRFQRVLVHVAGIVIDMYYAQPDHPKKIENSFKRLEKILHNMIKYTKELMKLQGCVDLALTTADLTTQSNRLEKSLLMKI